MASELKPCPDCQGEGRIPIGEHFVTRDMAIDAGEPNMEGMSMGIEWGTCSRCQGGGLLDDDGDAGENAQRIAPNRQSAGANRNRLRVEKEGG
jgi:hypothetical protein